jgi:signal transduction histidine kinase
MFEKKEIELNKEPFDLKGLIQEVLDTMRLQFEKSNAVVNFNSAGDNFIIKADKLHITSVIYNLLDNALKYSRENLIINIQLSQHHDIFEVKISDNGIGIAKEYKDKIFDKFFRVPTGNKQAVKGYGLGLSYVSEIIKRHMGYIYAESELGNGSTFIAQIPVKEAEVIWFDDNRSIRRISMRIPGKKKI